MEEIKVVTTDNRDPFLGWIDYDLVKARYCTVFLQKDEKFLFLYRNGKKANDPNLGKWLGVGGRIEWQETAWQAAQREVYEETGYQIEIDNLRFIGQVVYISTFTESTLSIEKTANKDNNTQVLSIAFYHVQEFSGEQVECSEGELQWMYPEDFLALPHWTSDDIFMPFVFRGEPFGYLYCFYQDQEFIRYLGPQAQPLTAIELEKLYLAHISV